MKNIFDLMESRIGTYVGYKAKDMIAAIMRTEVDPKLEELMQKLHRDIMKVRPNMGQTLGNWWRGLKDFAGRYWHGKYRDHVEYMDECCESYNAKLYNTSNSYIQKLYEETDPYNLQEVLYKLKGEIRNLIYQQLQTVFVTGYKQGMLVQTKQQAPKKATLFTEPELELAPEPPKPS